MLTQMVENHPSINMFAINNAGQDLRVGVEEGGVTALTWGVFPNREILQPVSLSIFIYSLLCLLDTFHPDSISNHFVLG